MKPARVTFGAERPLVGMRVLPAAWPELMEAPEVRLEALPTERLILKALTRDRQAERTLYERHAGAIHRFAADLVRDRADASDAVQETFVRAFRLLPSLSDKHRFVPWLYAIARNVCLECLKARTRFQRLRAETAVVRAPSVTHADPERELLDRECAGQLTRALGRLSLDRRTVLLLRADHGMPYDAIASVMGWSLAKAKVEVHRARLELRAALDAGERR